MFFKIFAIKIYTLLHSFEPFVEALLPFWLRNLQNMYSERIKCLFRCWNLLTSHFIFHVWEYGGWVLKNAVIWAVVWALALSWWRVNRLRRLVFLRTTDKQMVLYHSELTILHSSSGTITTYPVFTKKQANMCLEVLSARANFVGFGSSWNIFSRKSRIYHLSRYHKPVSKHRDRIVGSFLPNQHESFVERLTNCMGSNANKFFWQSNVHAILNVCTNA